MGETHKVTRRKFLKQAAITGAALAVPTIIPARALGRDGHVAPSNRITTGHIGLNGMGQSDLRAMLARSDVQVRALCDVNWDRCGFCWALARDAMRAERPDLTDPGIRCTTDFRELLEWDDVDAIVIATPDHWHAYIALAALRAGKDVYCEKPLTHNIAEGQVLVAEVRRQARVLQVGSQQRSDRNFRFACELVRNGRIGQVRRIEVGLPPNTWLPDEPPSRPPGVLNYDLWLGPAPEQPYTEHRTDWHFRWQYDFAGGMVTDWGAHHIDIAHWALGQDRGGPTHITGHGDFPTTGLTNVPLNWEFELTYAGNILLRSHERFENGIRFIGDAGWVFVNRDRIDANPRALLNTTFAPGEERLYVSQDHHANFIDCVRTRRDPVAPVEVAHHSATACHLANIAIRTGHALDWDPVQECFTNPYPAAERYLSRAPRVPWTLA